MDTHQERILVVEDEPAIARLLKTCLESCGYAVQTAGGGEEGLRYAVEHHPDLVILDVRLPDLDGFEVCRQLRAINETVPVVMLTAMDRPLDQLRGLSHGADVYLTKPFDPVELAAIIGTLLDRTPP